VLSAAASVPGAIVTEAASGAIFFPDSLIAGTRSMRLARRHRLYRSGGDGGDVAKGAVRLDLGRAIEVGIGGATCLRISPSTRAEPAAALVRARRC
jgi:hypothetical protein